MTLTADERSVLEAALRRRSGSAALARRARCVLLWAGGERRVDIRAKLACNDTFVTRWTKAFEFQGLAGLASLHPGRAPVQPVAKLEARVLNKTLKHKPRDGSAHWTSSKSPKPPFGRRGGDSGMNGLAPCATIAPTRRAAPSSN